MPPKKAKKAPKGKGGASKTKRRGKLGRGSTFPLIITEGLSDLLRAHTEYLATRSYFDQFLVWRYTTSSRTLNTLLLTGIDKDENAADEIEWLRHMVKDFDPRYIDHLAHQWKPLRAYFDDPKLLFDLNKHQRRKLATWALENVIWRTKRIIHRAPKTTLPVVVYKTCSVYPTLPKPGTLPQRVLQVPFNSVSYDPQMNYGLFIMSPKHSILMRIVIPAGSSVLSINPTYHAYPFEREIVIPPGAHFHMQSESEIQLSYIPKDEPQTIDTQPQGPPFAIGEVVRLDPAYVPKFRTAKMRYIDCVLVQH